MSNLLGELQELLGKYGAEVCESEVAHLITSTACIDSHIPAAQGVYWIETTMPVEAMKDAISEVIGKPKKLRENPPQGVQLITQKNKEFYVAYSGTEDNLNKRLKQHLFNQGHVNTAKLGCVIDELPFSNYQWKVKFQVIESYEIRYAIEAWWRLNKGWPPFCLR